MLGRTFAGVTEIVWRDGSGRDWRPHELEKSHLANIIYHITTLPGSYSKTMFEAMVVEADSRGMTDEYLAKAPYPYIDDLTGVKMIAVYSNGVMKPKLYDDGSGIDHFVLQVGSSVQGVALDPTVFGDPVWKKDLPKTTKEAKYDANDIIPWTHDVGAAILTYWLQLSEVPERMEKAYADGIKWRKRNYVLLKVSQKNRYGITHLIVKDDDLRLYDPETV